MSCRVARLIRYACPTIADLSSIFLPTSGKALRHCMERGMHPRDDVTCWQRHPSPGLWPAIEQTRLSLEDFCYVA